MYYLISFIYKRAVLYCIWVSAEEDYVITKDTKVLFFDTIDALKEYEQINNISVEKNEEVRYDIDKMILWCEDEKSIDCSCDELLNLWNICLDFAKSLGKEFLGDLFVYDDLYEKLFLANGLFIDNPLPQSSLLCFSKEEIISIKEILTNGIEIIVESM